VGDELAQIANWRTNVAELVTDCCERWDLRAGEPYVPGVCGHVARVDLADGTPAVLKISGRIARPSRRLTRSSAGMATVR
jgi:hypothetical protein